MFRYPFEGLAVNELSNIVFAGCSPQAARLGLCFPTGASILARYDLNPDRQVKRLDFWFNSSSRASNRNPSSATQWANLGILAAYLVAFEAGKALALHRISHLRR
eukprot:tig00000963_g5820.t1